MARSYKRDNIGRFASTGGSGSGGAAKKSNPTSSRKNNFSGLKNAVQSHRSRLLASNGVEKLMRKNGVIPRNEHLYRRPGEPWSSEYKSKKK